MRGRRRRDRPSPPASSAAEAAAKAAAATPLAAAGLSAVRAVDRAAAPRRLHRRRAGPRPRQADHPAARHRQRAPLRAGPPVPRVAPAVQPPRGGAVPRRTSAVDQRPGPKHQDQDRRIERTGASPQPQTAPPAVAPPSSRSPRNPPISAQLSVDDVVRHSSPTSPELAQVAGLAARCRGRARQCSPWAGQQEIARATGMAETDVAAHTERLRARWAKSVPALTPVRDDVVEILREHGGIMGWPQSRGRPAGPARFRARRSGRAAAGRRDLRARRGRHRGAPGERPDGVPRRAAGGAAGTGSSIALTRSDRAPTRRRRRRAARRRPVRLRGAARRPGRRARRAGPAARRHRDQAGAARRLIKLTLGDAIRGHLPGCPTPTWSCSPPPRRRRPRRPPASSCIPATCPRTGPEDLPGRQLPRRRVGHGELVRRVLARFPDLAADRRRRRTSHGCSRSGYDATRGTDGLLSSGQAPSSAAHVGHSGRPNAAARARCRRRGGRARTAASRAGPHSAAASSRSRPASPERHRRSTGWPAGRRHRGQRHLDVHHACSRASSKSRAAPAGTPCSPPTRRVGPARRQGRLRPPRQRHLGSPRGAHPCRRPKRYRSAARRDPASPLPRRHRAAGEAGGARPETRGSPRTASGCSARCRTRRTRRASMA